MPGAPLLAGRHTLQLRFASNARVQAAIDALTAQTSAIEAAVLALNLAAIDFEGSDSLDDPEAVFE